MSDEMSDEGREITSRENGDGPDRLAPLLRRAFGPTPEPVRKSLESLIESARAAARRSRILLKDTSGETPSPAVKPPGGEDLTPDAPIEGHDVAGEIARGGVGVVLKGRDQALGREVAIKVLGDDHADNAGMIQRFFEEAQIGGQLQHPGIVPVHAVGQRGDGRPYFTMKLVKGRTLAALLGARESPVDDRHRFFSIFEKICETIAYAHARGVVHRDLKPSNIMVGAFGEVLIMDWGLAKVLRAGGSVPERRLDARERDATIIETTRSGTPAALSRTGSVMGTLAYMPPEQACGLVDAIDERSDVFALGAILCEILTGMPPYVSETVTELRRAAEAGDLTEAHRRIRATRVDEELKRIVLDCLAADRHERPKNAGAVTEYFSRYLASAEERTRTAEVSAARAEARATSERRARRMTVIAAAALVGAVLLLAGAYLWYDGKRREEIGALVTRITSAEEEARVAWRRALASGAEDPAPWNASLAAARRAQALARSLDPDSPVVGHVAALIRDIEGAAEQARQSAARIAKDRRMKERLRHIRVAMDPFDMTERDRSYRAAFRDYFGTDVLELEPEDLGARIIASAIRAELADAVNEWTLVHRSSEETTTDRTDRLLAVSQIADRDTQRHRIREIVLTGTLDALKEEAARLDPAEASPETVVLVGRHLRVMGDPAGSLAFLRRAHAHHRGDFWVNFEILKQLSLSSLGTDEEALRFAYATLALRPRNAVVWTYYAQSLLRLEALEGAEEAARKAVGLAPESPYALTGLYLVLKARGKLDEGLEVYGRAVAQQPGNTYRRFQYALTLERSGRLDEAIAQLERTVRDKPDFATAHYELGLARRKKGDVTGSLDAFRRAIRHARERQRRALTGRRKARGPSHDFSRVIGYSSYHIAEALYGRRDLNDTQDLLDQALEAYPRAAAFHCLRSATLRLLGDPDRAREAAARAVEIDSGYARAQVYLGHSLMQLGRYEEALERFEKGKSLSVDWTEYVDRLKRECEWRATVSRRLDDVLRDNETVDRPREQAYLGEICVDRGLTLRAVTYFEAALRAEPALGREGNRNRFLAAARAAALAAAGRGKDLKPTDEAETARLRSRAVEWLGAMLDVWESRLEQANGEEQKKLRLKLKTLKQSLPFAPLRDAPALAGRPEREKTACEALWSRVDRLLRPRSP